MLNPHLNPSSDNLNLSDKEIEKVIRPSDFREFFGQEKVVENLKIFVHAAKQRGESLDHVLLHGLRDLEKLLYLISLLTKWASMYALLRVLLLINPVI